MSDAFINTQNTLSLKDMLNAEVLHLKEYYTTHQDADTIPPTFVITDATNLKKGLVSPWKDEEERGRCMAALRQLFVRLNIVNYIFIGSVNIQTAEDEVDGATDEVIMICAVTASENKTTTLVVHRNDDGIVTQVEQRDIPLIQELLDSFTDLLVPGAATTIFPDADSNLTPMPAKTLH